MTVPGPLPPRAGPVVDADGHVVEPEAAWAGLPDACRPRIAPDRGGYEHVVVGDTEILAVPLGNLARPGSTFDDPTSFRPLADALPGGWDPVERLGDMDAEGIDQAVLYPTIGLYFSVVARPRRRGPPGRCVQRLAGRLLRGRRRAVCSELPCSRCTIRPRPPASCGAR